MRILKQLKKKLCLPICAGAETVDDDSEENLAEPTSVSALADTAPRRIGLREGVSRTSVVIATTFDWLAIVIEIKCVVVGQNESNHLEVT